MKLAIIAVALGSLVWADPITITGHGTFETNSLGGYCDLTFIGQSPTDSSFSGVSGGYLLTYPGGCGFGVPGGYFSGLSQLGSGTIVIDGQPFRQGFAQLSLFGGVGSVTGFDASHNPVVTQELIGYLNLTSYSCVPDGFFHQICDGTFDVLATPEPATWLLGAAGLVGLLWRRKLT